MLIEVGLPAPYLDRHFLIGADVRAELHLAESALSDRLAQYVMADRLCPHLAAMAAAHRYGNPAKNPSTQSTLCWQAGPMQPWDYYCAQGWTSTQNNVWWSMPGHAFSSGTSIPPSMHMQPIVGSEFAGAALNRGSSPAASAVPSYPMRVEPVAGETVFNASLNG